MIEVLGCILIIGASTLGGFLYSEHFRQRVKQLNEVERSIYQLQNEIIYTHTPIPEALSNVSDKGAPPISEVFYKISDELYTNKYDTVYEAFKSVFDSFKANLSLKNEDVNVLLDLAKALGESDINGQVSIFSLTIDNLKKHIKDADLVMKRNVKMYRYLGFSIGAMLVIMLI